MEAALATFGSIRAAAQHLGMPKSTFADKAKAWGLSTRRKQKIAFPNPEDEPGNSEPIHEREDET
jgi:hypothetical protein